MVAINKFVLLAVVASVLVVAAKTGYAQEAPEGGVRAFGRKIVDGGSSILSHIPIVNRFFGHNGDKAPAAEQKAAPAEEEKKEAAPAAEEEKAAVEEPAKADETPAKADETPAKEAEPKAEAQAEKPAEESQ